MFLNLGTDTYIQMQNGVAAGSSNVTVGPVAIGNGFDSIMIIAPITALVANSVVSLVAQDGNLSNGGDAANITIANGANVCTPPATLVANDANSFLWLDVIRPAGACITAILQRATQNATPGPFFFISYNSKSRPTTQPAVVPNGAIAGGVFLAAT